MIVARLKVLSVTILETTKTLDHDLSICFLFYRSQFWRLQKPTPHHLVLDICFIGHNFGDYKNHDLGLDPDTYVLSVTILETTKTSNGIS